MHFNFKRIGNDIIERCIDRALGKLDKYIDTEPEREKIAKDVVAQIEHKLGGDIPLLSDEEEIKIVLYVLKHSDLLIKAAIKLDIL